MTPEKGTAIHGITDNADEAADAGAAVKPESPDTGAIKPDIEKAPGELPKDAGKPPEINTNELMLSREGQIFQKSIEEGSIDNSLKHFVEGEGFKSRGKGISGAHNMKEFYNTLTSTGESLDDMLVGKPVPHPTINGIYEQLYKIPKYDGKRNIVGFENFKIPKTIYDPKVISDEQMMIWGKEAMENATFLPNDVHRLIGRASNGLQFEGYVSDGIITNFTPTID